VKTGTAGGVRFQFTGRENDGVSNLYYYRARYYSAQLGRFISEDPIGLAGGMNLYGYVHGDPISNTDPTGEIIPVAVGYARCLASCVAQDAVASQLPGSNCFDLRNSAGNCALGCLSPLNWFGLNKILGAAQKSRRPQIWKNFPTRKKAKDAAANSPKGPFQKDGKTQGPERHADGLPHYHDGNHNNYGKPNIHYTFPKQKF
jgi:RHS repeat-associated protein